MYRDAVGTHESIIKFLLFELGKFVLEVLLFTDSKNKKGKIGEKTKY